MKAKDFTVITAKKRGRPKEFDRSEALEAALKVFWLKGYDRASMKDLTKAMNINGPSLYAEFGDKQSLYELAIDEYIENDACEPLVAFEREIDIHTAVKAFMRAAIDYATPQESGARGCFLSSCVATSAGEIEGIDEKLQHAIAQTDERLARRFDEEKANGLLPADFPSLTRARLMFDLRQGHVFRARSGCNPNDLKRDIDFQAKIILG